MLKSNHTTPTLTLTGRGRARAVLMTIEERWDRFTPAQQARALELLSVLSAAMRRDAVLGIRVEGEVPAQAR